MVKGLHMLAFLVEVLEKGMQQVQVPVLNVIHCMLHYIDLSSQHAQPISTDLIRVIAKYLDVSISQVFDLVFFHSKSHSYFILTFQNPYWKDALKILKLVVTRSSTLQVVPQGSPGGTSHHYYGSFSDSEVFCKKVCYSNISMYVHLLIMSAQLCCKIGACWSHNGFHI